MDSLLDKLKAYSMQGCYPMHMPGHKRNTDILKSFDPYKIDITEIDGFDNLHHAEDIIKSLIKRIEQMYQSEESHILVNGSTVGILAGISGCTKQGDHILMARNSHKSVYNAAALNGLEPVYLYPKYDGVYGVCGGVSAEEIDEILSADSKIRLVVITSPTYEGIISNVKKIAEVCHKHHVPLMVDEAHGAHLGLGDGFPIHSVAAGADLVIHSIHKTLPAFTQTALMHVNGPLVSKERVKTYLGIYETSSPSYILMAGVDQCIRIIEEQGAQLYKRHLELLDEFKKKTDKLKKIRIMKLQDYSIKQRQKGEIYDIDPSKILISVKNTNITGAQLLQRLRLEYQIQLEMSSLEYGLAMTSICDYKEGYERLADALIEIDQTLKACESSYSGYAYRTIDSQKERVVTPYEAMHCKHEMYSLRNAQGRVAANHIMVYPPGVPVVAAGERITKEAVDLVLDAIQQGLEVLGLMDDTEAQEKVLVLTSDTREVES